MVSGFGWKVESRPKIRSVMILLNVEQVQEATWQTAAPIPMLCIVIILINLCSLNNVIYARIFNVKISMLFAP